MNPKDEPLADHTLRRNEHPASASPDLRPESQTQAKHDEEARWGHYRPGGQEFTSEPGVLRKCTKCGHFECPFCGVWCDTFLTHEDDPEIEEDDNEMCCDGECTYDREPDPRLDAFLKEHAFDRNGIGRASFSENEDGSIVAYIEPPKTEEELAADAARKVEEKAQRAERRKKDRMKEVLSKTMKSAIKAMSPDGKGIYLAVDFGKDGVMSAILKDDADPQALNRLGEKVFSDWTQKPNVAIVAVEEAASAAIVEKTPEEAKVEAQKIALIEHVRAWVKNPEANGGVSWLQDNGGEALALLVEILDDIADKLHAAPDQG